MAHFAQLNENNIVTQVIVVNDEVILDENNQEQESLGIEFCKSLYGADTNWKQTSYNKNFRGNYAGVGTIYDSSYDAFYIPQPYNSWTLNTGSFKWEAPVEHPTEDGNIYTWDENLINWVTSSLE
jgi:hypothetical protein